MKAQTVFNKVWNGLKAQGFQRSRDNDHCMYRGPKGMKCAAGQLMTDKQAHALDNAKGGSELTNLRHMGVKLPAVIEEHFQMVVELQAAHDSASTDSTMQNALKRVAFKFGLTVPE